MAGFAPLDLALARLSFVRSARLRQMAAPAADRPDPRLQADAGGHQCRDTHRRVRRRERLAGPSAATGCESEPVVVLELVRRRDQRRQGRSGDRRVAGTSGAASLSRSPTQGVRGRNVGRRLSGGGAGLEAPEALRGRIRPFGRRVRRRVGSAHRHARAHLRRRHEL